VELELFEPIEAQNEVKKLYAERISRLKD